jgi:DNA replication and repair protein RecF
MLETTTGGVRLNFLYRKIRQALSDLAKNRRTCGQKNLPLSVFFRFICSYMRLQELYLLNFKNYAEARFTFGEGIHAITGLNGSGKTNLLDAVHFLCLTKSAFLATDTPAIRYGETFLMLRGLFEQDQRTHTVECALQQNKKTMRLNGKAYTRLSEHIGAFPLVLLTPYDTDLIREGSEERRKFFDGTLSQWQADYLDKLLQYNALLKQRNALLKQFAERNHPDYDLLEAYDRPLIPLAQTLAQARRQLLDRFEPIFAQHYRRLASEAEQVRIEYVSEAQKPDFEEIFRKALPKDLLLQRTTQGAHRDDFDLLMNDRSVGKFGSQGQQKSFVLALKLAQYDLLHTQKGFAPLLLLDDIFDKLDDRRMAALLETLSARPNAQVLLTDARPERTRQLFAQIGLPVHLTELQPAN